MSNRIDPILTPEFRLSFCNLFEAKPDMNGFVRFQMEMLFPKDRGGNQFIDMKRIYDAQLAIAKFSAGGPAPRTFRDAIIDGSSKKQEGRHGMFMLKANSGKDFPPRVILQNGAQAENNTGPKGVYEGCWCRAIVSPFTYEAKHKERPNVIINRGVGYNMLTVQKVRDDEPFSSIMSTLEQDALLAQHPLTQQDAIARAGGDDLADLM